jgi:cytochrome c oxidase assembly factor CtaG
MRRLSRGLAAAMLALPAAPALAHAGHDHEIGWTLAPSVTVPLALAALVYALGLFRLWRRSDRGRPALRREALLFASGWLSLAGALCSPLHEAGERSFTMHMIEHEIIMLVSALLLFASRPGAVLLWGLPALARRALAPAGRWPLWRSLADPFLATAIQGAAIILWHAPPLFDLALRHEGWHVVQHLCFLGSALLFWRAMIPGRGAHGAPFISAVCLFVTSMIGAGLGALMTLAASPWYAPYAAMGMTLEGLSPTEDQQLAGLIMWVPGGLYHLAAALWFLLGALQLSEPEGLPHREREREQAPGGDENADGELPAAPVLAHERESLRPRPGLGGATPPASRSLS